MALAPYAVHRAEAPAHWSLGELLTVLVPAERTGGAFSLVEELLPRGAEAPPHVHRREHELLVVLEGELTARIGDETHAARAGSVLFFPRDVPHQVTVDSDVVRLLTLMAPGGLEQLLVDLGEPARDRALPPPGVAVPPPERIGRLAGEHGVRVLGDSP